MLRQKNKNSKNVDFYYCSTFLKTYIVCLDHLLAILPSIFAKTLRGDTRSYIVPLIWRFLFIFRIFQNFQKFYLTPSGFVFSLKFWDSGVESGSPRQKGWESAPGWDTGLKPRQIRGLLYYLACPQRVLAKIDGKMANTLPKHTI